MSRAALATTLWILCMAVAASIVVRARYSTDLSAFLPRRATPMQQLLVEQLHEGPAAHLILAAVSGADADARAEVSRQMAQRLRANPSILAIDNGDEAQLQRDRQFLFEHRYLLSARVSPGHFTAAGLHQAIAEALETLASPAGPMAKPLFLRDPTLELLAILESLDASHAPHTAGRVWSSPDGTRALLLAHTRASGADIDGQQAALASLRGSFDAARATLTPAERAGFSLTVSGPPVFAVKSRATIKSQVWRLSSISAAGIAALLSLGYYGAATSGDGQGYELNVIAAAVVGGASLSGGKGSALGALLGALVIQLIGTGIVILGINQNYGQIIIGVVVIVAVVLDQLNNWLAKRRVPSH